MTSWKTKTAGFVLASLVPLLMAALVWSGQAIVFPVLIFCVAPLVGLALGPDQTRADSFPAWDERVTAFLACLPVLYLPTMVVGAAVVANELSELTPGEWSSVLAAWLVAGALATSAAHELLHRRESSQRWCARLLAAVIGYPHLTDEHLLHHAVAGHHALDGLARRGESVYRYAARQGWSTFAECWAMQRVKTGHAWVHPLATASCVTALVAAAFAWVAGPGGLLFYGAGAVLVWFAVQTINYIQHYGLGIPPPAKAGQGWPSAWDDTCFIEACLTFNILYHEQHHREPHRPYWQLERRPSRAVLPASYSVMFFVALVPPLFYRVMDPRIDGLQRNFEEVAHAPREALCTVFPSRD